MRETKVLEITSIVKSAGFGASEPLVVLANDGKKYILKTRCEGFEEYKDLGIFNEMLSYHLETFLNLKVAPQNICYFIIDKNVQEMAKEAKKEGIITTPHSLGYILNSTGINIGIEYIDSAGQLFGDVTNKKFKENLMRLDNYIINCDRVPPKNPNILQDRRYKNKYYAIDFGNALADWQLYEKLLEGKDVFERGQFNHCNALISSKAYIFTSSANMVKFKKISYNIEQTKSFLSQVFESMPEDWEPLKFKEELIDIIACRLHKKEIFKTNQTNRCECMY